MPRFGSIVLIPSPQSNPSNKRVIRKSKTSSNYLISRVLSFFRYKTEIFLFQNIHKNLDLSNKLIQAFSDVKAVLYILIGG